MSGDAPAPTPEQIAAKANRDAVLKSIEERSQATTGTGRIRGKVCIVTGVGPASGIGAQAARLLAREGATALYLLDVSAALPEFAGELQKTFPNTKISHTVGDAADDAFVAAAVQKAVDEHGRLDVYFANAGISHLKPKAPEGGPPQLIVDMVSGTRTAQDISAAEFGEVMRVNALSVFLALKYAVPAMTKTGAGKPFSKGSIISTASVAGINANAGPLIYSATKAAVINMTKNAAYEVAGTNVRINCICPGLIKTDMTKTIFDLAALAGVEESVGLLNPLGRHGAPEEIGQAVLWLASDESSYVNGHALVVDGAFSASMPYVPGSKERVKELISKF